MPYSRFGAASNRADTNETGEHWKGSRTPLLLAIGGHDPSGAGIQADIETAAAFGCHAATLVTCLTVQNTRRVLDVIPMAASTLRAQYLLLFEDWGDVAACKIGLVPTVEVVQVLAELVRGLPAGCPLVIDPVIAAGSGTSFMDDDVRGAVLDLLWPLATVRTPNVQEASVLAERAGAAGSRAWREAQRGWVLVKGADAISAAVEHQLERDGCVFASYRWPRLPGRYHGTGCTVATAIAAGLAQGDSVAGAVSAALDYTWKTLLNPLDFGGAQQLPRRLGDGRS